MITLTFSDPASFSVDGNIMSNLHDDQESLATFLLSAF